jgi:hypothetical protein
MDELKAKPVAELQQEIALLTAKGTEESLKDASKRVKAIKQKIRMPLRIGWMVLKSYRRKLFRLLRIA